MTSSKLILGIAMGIALLIILNLFDFSTVPAKENSSDIRNDNTVLETSDSNQNEEKTVIEKLIDYTKPHTADEAIFRDNFDRKEYVFETGEPEESTSASWWVNSGGYLKIHNGIASTIIGRLPENSDIAEKYAEVKGERTDGGFRPQNIFRLLMQKSWLSATEKLRFRVVGTDSTNSVQRAGSNGVLLFGRYSNQDNLYYAGIRVDGDLVIKKKINGEYYTLAQKQIFFGEYNKDTNPNLIPTNTWLVVTGTFKNIGENSVEIALSIDTTGDGASNETIVALDDGTQYGGEAFRESGYGGIRTDFMDVEFDEYSILPISS